MTPYDLSDAAALDRLLDAIERGDHPPKAGPALPRRFSDEPLPGVGCWERWRPGLPWRRMTLAGWIYFSAGAGGRAVFQEGAGVTQYVVQFSGGLASWTAAMRIAERHGRDRLRLLFCDTLYEDEDLYRFLIEGAAEVFGLLTPEVRALASRALLIPAVEDERWEERKAAIAELRAEATAAIPGLNWIADGRGVWEVYHDERYIGNARVDPCSKLLKREIADRWHKENCDIAETVRVLGLTFAETKRIGRLEDRFAADGWACDFPMTLAPWLTKTGMMHFARDRGIEPPRLYKLGFKNNNCGGFCCKAGQASLRLLLNAMPRRYAHHERREQAERDYLGKDVGVLRDRSGGAPKTMTLTQFRERVQVTGLYDESDWGACSCFTTAEDAME